MLAILIVLAITTFFFVRFFSKVKQLPPGPLPLPLIGNLHQMAWGVISTGDVVSTMRRWQEKYGDVFTMWLGPWPTVNICDYHAANDAMVKKGAAFAVRPYLFIADLGRQGRGVIVSNGEHWTEQRRFALHTLRNFGLGRNLMEDRIMLEYNYRTENLNKILEEHGGTYNFDPYHFIELTVGNVINRLLFSDRFTEEKETRFFALKKALDSSIENMGVFDILLNEWTVKIPPFNKRYQRVKEPFDQVIGFIEEQIEQKKMEMKKGPMKEEGEDFVESFLIQMAKDDRPESFDEMTLKMTLLDLWFAGQETTTTTLYWAITYLLLHPVVQRNLHAELDSVTGRNRSLGLTDKPQTPYLNATITEILRLSSIVQLSGWKEAADDVVVGEHLIPKGTSVTAQVSLLLSDKKVFDEPHKFKPERFLEKGVEQYSVPFGMGKRSCLGESLARAELYLIFGNLVSTYEFAPDEEHPAQMKAKSEMGTIRQANRYHVNMSRRH